MRIAQHDARAHANELVDEEHPRLEHLLVHQDESVALSSGHDGDGHEVRRERGPRLILELGHVAAKVRADGATLLRGDDQIVADDGALDAETLESHARGAEMLDASAHDPQLGSRDRREPDERADLDVIGTDAMRSAVQRLRSVNRERVRADPFDRGAERDEEMREILHVRLARRVAQGRSACSETRRHECILGGRDARLIEKDVGAAKAARTERVLLSELDEDTELLEGQEVRVDPPAPDDVATGRRKSDRAASREQRPGEKDRGTDPGAEFRVQRARLYDLRLDRKRIARRPLGGDAQRANQLDERLDVANVRDVLEYDLLIGEQRGRDDGQRSVLVAGRMDRAGKRVSTFDDVAQRGSRDEGEKSGPRARARRRKNAPRRRCKSRNMLDNALTRSQLRDHGTTIARLHVHGPRAKHAGREHLDISEQHGRMTLIAHLGTAFAQLAAATPETTLVHTANSGPGWYTVFSQIVGAVTALVFLALMVILIPAVAKFRKTATQFAKVLQHIEHSIDPVAKHASRIADNVEYVTTSVRADVQELRRTLHEANSGVRSAIDASEQRLHELGALLRLAQNEAEHAFVSTASTLRGMQAGAASFQEGVRPLDDDEDDDLDDLDVDTVAADDAAEDMDDGYDDGPAFGRAEPRIKRRGYNEPG